MALPARSHRLALECRQRSLGSSGRSIKCKFWLASLLVLDKDATSAGGCARRGARSSASSTIFPGGLVGAQWVEAACPVGRVEMPTGPIGLWFTPQWALSWSQRPTCCVPVGPQPEPGGNPVD